MTDKERLEEINRFASHKVLENNKGEIRYRLTEINTKDYEWLIEQAEQRKALETTVDFYQSALRDADRRVKELEDIIYRDERQTVLEGLY